VLTSAASRSKASRRRADRDIDAPSRPGLTLVVGRNGSGKSSFAEGLECGFAASTMRRR
jgi:chromosome segregation ATPase